MLLAVRRLWAPNTITSVHGRVPIHPLGPDGVYRRDEYDRREALPKDPFTTLRRTFRLDDDINEAHIGLGDYAYHQGGVSGLGGVYFGHGGTMMTGLTRTQPAHFQPHGPTQPR